MRFNKPNTYPVTNAFKKAFGINEITQQASFVSDKGIIKSYLVLSEKLEVLEQLISSNEICIFCEDEKTNDNIWIMGKMANPYNKNEVSWFGYWISGSTSNPEVFKYILQNEIYPEIDSLISLNKLTARIDYCLSQISRNLKPKSNFYQLILN